MNKRDRIVVALEDMLRRFSAGMDEYDPVYDKGYLENLADEIVSDDAPGEKA